MTVAEYLTFTAASGLLFGFLVAWGLGYPARHLARRPMSRAILIYMGLPVPGVVFAALGLLWRGTLTCNGPGEYGAGASIEVIVTFLGTVLGCWAIGILLAIGRRSTPLMSAIAVALGTVGWAVAGIETFWLGDFVTRGQLFDANAYSPALGWMSTAVFLAIAAATAWCFGPASEETNKSVRLTPS